MKNSTIMINGRLYDAITGMPVVAKAISHSHTAAQSSPQLQPVPVADNSTASKSGNPKLQSDISAASVDGMTKSSHESIAQRKANHAVSQHRRTQRSHTLHRAALKRPDSLAAATTPQQILRSDAISKFNNQSRHALSVKTAQSAPKHSAPVSHTQRNLLPPKQNITPINRQAHVATAAAVPDKPQFTAPKDIEALQGNNAEEELIREQLDQVSSQHSTPTETRSSRVPRMATVVTSVIALVMLGGYLTYLNLPSLSIRVAAAQAGIDASFPTYQPAGYAFAGPVAFSPGEVRVNFQSNTAEHNYTLVQRNSGWDSQAVLDNYVLEETKEYATLQERGLTIYLMENKAAWVNGGILYVIDGNAPLSSEQIQKIASSTL